MKGFAASKLTIMGAGLAALVAVAGSPAWAGTWEAHVECMGLSTEPRWHEGWQPDYENEPEESQRYDDWQSLVTAASAGYLGVAQYNLRVLQADDYQSGDLEMSRDATVVFIWKPTEGLSMT